MKPSPIVFILLLTIILPLGVNGQKPTKEKKDPYTSTELWEPVPINRAHAHDKIDNLQKAIDEYDRKKDQIITITGQPEVSEAATKAIIKEVDRIEIVLENVPNDHFTKLRYLGYLEDDVQAYYNDMVNNKVDVAYYTSLIKNYEVIFKKLQEGEDILSDVNNNFTKAYYGHRKIFKNDKAITEAIYEHMVQLYPKEMLKKTREFDHMPAATTMMNYVATQNPNLILTYATSTSRENTVVRRSKDSLVIKIIQIADQSTRPQRAITFLDDLMENKITIPEINRITEENALYYKQLVLQRAKANPRTKRVVERESKLQALEYVRIMNELHDSPDPVRFKCIETLTPQEMYFLMVLCSDEIYTSTFVGTFNRMLLKMSPMPGDTFLQGLGMDKFRTFIRMCAGYNKLDEYLTTMGTENKNNLMASFVHNIDANTETDVEDAVDIADACGSIRDEKLLDFIMLELKKDYERTYQENDKRGLVIYFLLNTLCTSILYPEESSVELQNQLKVPPIAYVPYQNLVNSSGEVVEQVFFYGDDDGKSSLNNYLANYKPTEWKIEKNAQWMTITSLTGKPIKIYANLPLDEPQDEEAQTALTKYLTDNNINPSVIIHRGHSYHLNGTLKHIKEHNKVIILGSCGGYHNLSTILAMSDDAHIVSSKQTGTMYVTDPIIKSFNTRLSNGDDINWINLWDEVAKQMNTPALEDKFNDYVPPHKNMGALFLKAFKIQSKEIGLDL
jgi:hypothetical protein